MQTFSSMFNYYNNLSPQKKWVVDMLLLSVSRIDRYDIYRLSHYSSLKITQKLISEVIQECEKEEIIIKDSFHDYSVNFDFFMHIFPQISAYSVEWKEINAYRFIGFYGNNTLFKIIRNYLYALFYEKENIKEYEQSVLAAGGGAMSYFETIFEHEGYKPVLSLINPVILKNAAVYKINSDISQLRPLGDILASEASNYMPFDFFHCFFNAGFSKAIAIPNAEEHPNFYFIQACQSFLKENDTTQAFKLFEKGLKKQRSNYRTSQVPFEPYSALTYIVLLTQIEPEKNAPIFRKIIQSLEKKQYTLYDSFFLMMCEYTMSNQKTIEANLKKIETDLFFTDKKFAAVIGMILFYFSDYKPQKQLEDKIYELVDEVNKNGYLILALEAAFVLNQWWNTDKYRQLYEQIRRKAGYEPLLSRLNRQEDWEKTLNQLLGMIAPQKGKVSTDPKTSERVVYEINIKHKSVQPILQKRLSKGGWSSGRNIALKTFSEKNIDVFTEQDYRVVGCLKYHRDSYYYRSGYYEFSSEVFKELIGHPYLFLPPPHSLQVELVAGDPILQVNKVKGGYRLIGNIENVDDEIILEKETNTRYKVYSLNDSQKNILKTIAQQQIIIPEKGKEKLSKVLGSFSSQITVHSDIVESDQQAVRSVKADERIRVQLLPAGGGLKVEFFCKPFGEHPPYCKPGVGGKILISNQNGERKQVLRNLKKETEWADKLISEIQSLENIDTNEELISFDDPQDCLFLLEVLEKHKDIAVVEWPEGERYKIKRNIDFKNINIKIKHVNNWFELQGDVRINEKTVLSIQQLLALSAQSKNRFVELGEGEFIALSKQLKKQLDELHSLTEIDKKGVRINKFAAVSAIGFFDEIENIKSDKAWKDFQKKLENIQKEQLAIPAGLQAELRPYQEEGFKWMARLAEWEAGGCLADDMGLGKTIQSLAILLHRVSRGIALVIAPVSVIPNWISETKKFAPSLNIKTLASGNRKETIESLESGDLLITSYGLMQSEIDLLKEQNWATIILDEAHTIKNRDTKTSQAAMSLNASFKLALTGTPIQNHLGEIWNLFNFINPGMLGSLQHFNDTFVKPEGQGQKHLKKLITPFILRRTKTTVLDELPPKTEIIKKIDLSAEEMAFYEALRRQAIANIENDENNNGAKHIKALAEITRLRQACCNTALVDAKVKLPSAKLSVFLEIVSELKANNHRALVFSQFVSHLSLVRKELDKKGVNYQYLDGSTTLSEREKQVKQFQSGQTDLFLISLKAGGLGLNLTSADYVIHLDPWWNPAIEDQASDRAHRIGQIRPVTVYRLVAENTIEEKIIQLHNTKRNLADSLLEGSDQSGKLSTKELLELIRNN